MELKYKNFKEVLINIVVGIFIGLSVIVPGISGSTMAITLKVYDKGMYAFSHMFKEFKKCFLYALPVIGGIFVGFFGVVAGLQFLLDTIPFITICLFMGLMIGTYPVIFKEVKGERLSTKNVILTIVGFLAPILFSVLSLVLVDGQNNLENLNFGHYILFFVMGALISVTQLLPGLSATVLMMIFGYYSALMGGLHLSLFTDPSKLFVYISMGIGFLVGVFTISKLFEKILIKARKQFFFAVSGISVGSIISVFIGKDCMEIYNNWTFPMIVIELVLGVIALGCAFAVSFILTRYKDKREEKDKENNAEKNN